MSPRTDTIPTVVSRLQVNKDVVMDHIGNGVFISTVSDGVRLLDVDECSWALEMFAHFRKTCSEKEAIQKVVDLRAQLLEEESYFDGINSLRQIRQGDGAVPAWMQTVLVIVIVLALTLVSAWLHRV